MKIVWIMLLLLAFGQAGLAQCNCDRVALETVKPFDYEVSQAQALVNTYSRQFYNNLTIIAKPYACRDYPVGAVICGANQGQTLTKYIFYRTSFFTDLQKNTANRGDQFLLAHEIAHHVLGHTTRPYYLNPTQKAAASIPYTNTELVSKGADKRWQTHLINVPVDHLLELEADALGLWIASQNGTTRKDLQQLFSVLPILFNKDTNQASLSHPSLAMRHKLLDRQWARITKPAYLPRTATISGPTSLLDLTEVANTIHQDTEAIYAFELATADNELRNELAETERIIKRQLDRKLRFIVEPVVGWHYHKPQFSVDNEPVMVTTGSTVVVGARLGVGAWYKRHRLETDLLGGYHAFSTQARFGDDLFTTENFQTTYLHIRPRYVFTWLTHASLKNYLSHVLMATAGPSVTVPLAFQYTNFGVRPDAQQKPRQLPGYGLVAGLGYARANWSRQHGHLALWLLYQWQPLRFVPVVGSSPQATMHTLSLDASFRFWK